MFDTSPPLVPVPAAEPDPAYASDIRRALLIRAGAAPLPEDARATAWGIALSAVQHRRAARETLEVI